MPKIAISCVVDDQPKFLMQCWNWLCSLHAVGAHQRAEVFVHFIDGIDRARLQPFESLGAKLRPVAPFGEGDAAYCNKLQQLETAELRDFDYTILTDADLGFLQCPTRLAAGEEIAAKLVDNPNPPEAIWRQLISVAGLRDPACESLELNPGQQTFRGNCNGGLYVIPRAKLGELRSLWPKWAQFCLDQRELLGKYRHHADQLGFGLSALEAGLSLRLLDIYENFPAHLTRKLSRVEPGPIKAIHYHAGLDEHGLLKPTGIAWVDDQIRTLNAQLIRVRRSNFLNRIFWDFRYATAPALRSGVGSRGEVLERKRAMLLPYMRALSRHSVLEVGCGDLEVMRAMPLRSYMGIDLSLEALKLASQKRPEWTFQAQTIEEFANESHDVILCLDVLIHQSNKDVFERTISNCVRTARKAVIISGYKETHDGAGIVFAPGCVAASLSSNPDIAEVIEIGGYRDVTMFLAIKKCAQPANPHDITLSGLAYGCAESPDWELLLDLVELSRAQLGFFPSTIIRTIEYPWFAQRLRGAVRQRVLDIGAGICALPLWLARQGCQVFTVDNHSKVRTPPAPVGWNEWGFIDYGLLDSSISSAQVSVLDFSPETKFDVIYSVSVIEHMPANVRRQTLAKVGNWLTPAGRLLLSLDLTPNTDQLWPLSEGKIVDIETPHGSLQDVLSEIEAVGLRVVECGVRRGIAGSRTDVAFIEAAPHT